MANEKTVDELYKRIKQLENAQSFTIKEGEIIYVHDPEAVTEKFTKIDAAIDCSQVINGKMFPDYIAFQITKFNKDLFDQFDQTEGNEKRVYKKGDIVRVMVDVGSYQTTVDKKHNNRTTVYNNAALIKCQMIEKAAELVAEEDAQAMQAEAAAAKTEVKDDLPF